jgi:ribosomal protein L11 methyltransferase
MLDVVIDPGRAFGTGAHATTRLCLELLAEREPSGPLLDIGCGSGVLAIAGAKLGFAPVAGVDHEVESVEAARENARVNGVEVDVARADLRRDELPWAPTVTANLLRPLLLQLAERLPAEAPRTLIASGLLGHEADEVAAAFGSAGLREAARRVEGEWAALLLVRV